MCHFEREAEHSPQRNRDRAFKRRVRKEDAEKRRTFTTEYFDRLSNQHGEKEKNMERMNHIRNIRTYKGTEKD